ncbi:hypothetical protein HYFRA_00003864 [Hymenoscyphus fraxineus]|uniref:Neprosin domain-containing protein n=1 Tax=Hymenoscyphus fraxineus TaxID=746836 RepID=A0A9N9L1C2_9HELO|nr:hypothetical protein HYFRA_00003864 [Hymenoscyphus fraxineus]
MNIFTLLYMVCVATALPSWPRDDQASTSDAVWFLPNAPITRYQVTVIVPAVSPGGGYHAVWPGLQNEAGTFVFQSVIADSKSPGSWKFWVEYCCNPDYKANPIDVYPGDSITSTFTQDGNGVWTDSWSYNPGPNGAAAGSPPQSGSTTENFADRGQLIRGLLALEFQRGGNWDYGQVSWSNIAITASTTNGWCANGYLVSPAFNIGISPGFQSSDGGSTTCSWSNVDFRSP